jgi:hypothetical protein
MWIKVLTADPATEPYFREVPDDQEKAYEEFSKIVHGDLERISTQQLNDVFGDEPRVVMIVNINADFPHKLPVNRKASKFFPNEFNLPIRGEAILVGEINVWTDGEPDYAFVSIPEKWKILFDMESAARDYFQRGQTTNLHKALDNYLLRTADPDVAKYYEELRQQFTAEEWYG